MIFQVLFSLICYLIHVLDYMEINIILKLTHLAYWKKYGTTFMSHCFVIGPFWFSMAEVGGRERWFLQGLLYQAKIEKANSFIQSFAWASVSSDEVPHAGEGSIGPNTERNPSNAWYILALSSVCTSVPVCVKHKKFSCLKVNWVELNDDTYVSLMLYNFILTAL